MPLSITQITNRLKDHGVSFKEELTRLWVWSSWSTRFSSICGEWIDATDWSDDELTGWLGY